MNIPLNNSGKLPYNMYIFVDYSRYFRAKNIKKAKHNFSQYLTEHILMFSKIFAKNPIYCVFNK